MSEQKKDRRLAILVILILAALAAGAGFFYARHGRWPALADMLLR